MSEMQNHRSSPICDAPIHWDINGRAWRCKSWALLDGNHKHLRIREEESDIGSDHLTWDEEILDAASTGMSEAFRYGILIGIFFGIILSLTLLKIGGQI